MDLHEEYLNRRRISSPVVKYVERGSIILRKKSDGKNQWVHATIQHQTEPHHPPYYRFVEAVDPVIYATSDMSNFSLHNSNVIKDEKWEWDDYEKNIIEWAKERSKEYRAVSNIEARYAMWSLFVVSFDEWFANKLPIGMIGVLCDTLNDEDIEKSIEFIKQMENWLQRNNERVLVSWKNVSGRLDDRNYAEWLARIVNRKGN